MNGAANIFPAGNFDSPWRRLPWIIPAALIIWALLLGGFTQLLEYTSPPPVSRPIEARLVEIPSPVTGLQGGHAAAAPPTIHPAVKPKPRAEPIPKRVPMVHHRAIHRHVERPIRPPEPESMTGRVKEAAPAPSAPSHEAGKSAPASTESTGVAGGTGAGSGAGLGGDATGARAVYAPMPKIPDELRENALETVAVASFQVAADGTAQVTLVKPTSIPRLNYLLIQTLEQWRFFPAVKNGQPVPSAFELRIPITVQ